MLPINLSIRTTADEVCPACSSKGVLLFFEIRNIPVNCSAVFSSKEEAIRVPLGDLSLGFCEACGYIYNMSYAPSLLDKVGSYEDQQGFSPTFRKYSEGLANYLIDKYYLHKKTIVEIGCGKGDFIGLLCRLGDNRGIGIDPIGELGLQNNEESNRLKLINEYYSESHGIYKSKIIVCRHTLEHIQNPFEFVSSIYRAIGDKQDTVVFFEVPDVLRILNEKAFWDMYYEHCGYFSPGSVARLFRNCGFQVTEIGKVYDGQYIILEAKKAESGLDGNMHEIEETTLELHKLVISFSQELEKSINKWNREITEVKAEGKKLAMWGSGSKCVAFLSTLNIGNIVECIVDVNPKRQGMFLPSTGREIMAPNTLKKIRPDIVIVMNRIYEQEIREELSKMKLTPKVLAL